MKYKRVLITGGTGEIGSALLKRIPSSQPIVLLGRDRERAAKVLEERGGEFVECDLTSAADVERAAVKLKNVDALVHLAALVKGSNDVLNDVAEFVDCNISGTINLLKVLPRLEHVIFSSTCAVYGSPPAPAVGGVDESNATNPVGLYAVTNLVGEKLLGLHCEDRRIGLCVLRISSVYSPPEGGGGQKRAIALFAEKAERGETITLYGGGKEIKDYIYVDDVARGILWALAGRKEGIYNLSTGKGATVGDVARMIVALSGGGSKVKCEAKPGTNSGCFYNSDKARSEGLTCTYDLSRGLGRVCEKVRGTQSRKVAAEKDRGER